ncbi:MAG: glycosyltransferase family 4 protein, partial [Lentisphaerae bacterium]|nr:glycosyltransferase family 4 protein [Lentisphaerota bacterium]
DLIRDLILQGHKVVAASPDDQYKDDVIELGATFIKTSASRNGLSPLNDVGFCIELVRIVKRERIDMVFSSTIKQVIYGSIAARLGRVDAIHALITGLGYIFVSRGLKARLIGSVGRALYKFSLKFCSTVIFQNPDDKNTFVQLGLVDESKCAVVNGSGVNLNRFRPSKITNRNKFLCISRLVIDKGVREYLEAAKTVKGLHEDVEFHLVGGLDSNPNSLPKEELLAYIEGGYIEYHGPQTDVRPFLIECFVYVLPSYSEGTPRTVLEAMATGRAILTTDAPGCRETVVDGVNGFLVPVRNVEELVRRMLWMLKNPERCISMGNESLRIARAKYDVNKVNQELLRLMGLDGSDARIGLDTSV